ncbi:MAG: collagen binding domain-containing protein [Myxococcales bacterium]
MPAHFSPLPPSPPSVLLGRCTIAGEQSHAGIRVELMGTAVARVVTGRDGRFTFLGLPPGRYVLTATAPATREFQISRMVSVYLGARSLCPELRFTAFGELQGRILGPVRTGAAPLQVRVTGHAEAALVGPDGTWRLPRVPVGAHVLVVKRGGVTLCRIPATVRREETTVVPDMVVQP